jgi:hypothetical protein
MESGEKWQYLPTTFYIFNKGIDISTRCPPSFFFLLLTKHPKLCGAALLLLCLWRNRTTFIGTATMFGRNKENAVPREAETLEKLKRNLKQAYTMQRWDQADDAATKVIAHLKSHSETIGASQSELAEWHAQRGIALHNQRRYEPAFQQLELAERWLNMSLDEAIAFARQQDITLTGEGESLDTDLALLALETLAEAMVQRGTSGAGQVLEQVVKVADVVGQRERMWNARHRLATYTAGLADWDKLLRMGQELGQFANRHKSLSSLLVAMRFIVEALISMQRLDDARAAQRLVVDIARFINDASLPGEEAEMARLSAVK